MAAGSLVAAVVAVVIAVAAGIGGRSHHSSPPTASAHAGTTAHKTSTGGRSRAGSPAATAKLGVPILVYHVINSPPPGTSSPSLYVPASEFTAQMQALKAAGWHAVTLDQLEAHWTHGASLGTTKPIVISFDTGYASQYNTALPVLRQLGWVGVENLALNSLPASEGGITDSEIRALVSAGWELDSEGEGAADLTALSTSGLQYQVATARQSLHGTYGAPANWFAYPGGHYDATVMAAVKAAGYLGATTETAGWATAQDDRYALPRLTVAPGTSPSALLNSIATARSAAPPSASGGGTTGTGTTGTGTTGSGTTGTGTTGTSG